MTNKNQILWFCVGLQTKIGGKLEWVLIYLVKVRSYMDLTTIFYYYIESNYYSTVPLLINSTLQFGWPLISSDQQVFRRKQGRHHHLLPPVQGQLPNRHF
jgi:hypothetical protein